MNHLLLSARFFMSFSQAFGVVLIVSPHPTLKFPSTESISVTGAWHGGPCLGCRDLPPMRAVFYLAEGLAGHSGSSWVLQAPTSHFREAVGQLLYDQTHAIII